MFTSSRLILALSVMFVTACNGGSQPQDAASDSSKLVSDTATRREQIPGTPGTAGTDSTRPDSNHAARTP